MQIPLFGVKRSRLANKLISVDEALNRINDPYFPNVRMFFKSEPIDEYDIHPSSPSAGEEGRFLITPQSVEFVYLLTKESEYIVPAYNITGINDQSKTGVYVIVNALSSDQLKITPQ